MASRVSLLVWLLALAQRRLLSLCQDHAPPRTMVVSSVMMDVARTEHDAHEACVARGRGWLPTGVNWIDDDINRHHAAILCMKQVEMSELIEENGLVLQDVAIFRGVTACPEPMSLVVEPQEQLLLCAQYARIDTVLDTKRYVQELSISTELHFNHEAAGWLTWPVSVHVDAVYLYEASDGLLAQSSMGGSTVTAIVRQLAQRIKSFARTSDHKVFLSVRRPARAVTAVHPIPEVHPLLIPQRCDELEPVGSWEPSAFWSLHAFPGLEDVSPHPAGDIQPREAICVRRSVPCRDCDTKVVLTAHATSGDESCSGVPLHIGDASVCMIMGKLQSSFVSEVSLTESISRALASPWRVVSASARHALYVRESGAASPRRQLTRSEPKRPLQATPVFNQSDNSTIGLSFRILQIADMHFSGDPERECSAPVYAPWHGERVAGRRLFRGFCREAWTSDFVDLLLEIEQPDFVVFTGDNVHVSDPSRRRLAMDTYSKAVEERGIPWTMVFGNHDQEGGFAKEEMFKIVQNKKYSHVHRGPSDVEGIGNFALNVHAPTDGPWGKAGTAVFRMYFLDSHADADAHDTVALLRKKNGYDWIKHGQIDFYKAMAAAYATEDVRPTPAIMFFHIPLPEYAMASSSTSMGTRGEGIASPRVNSGLFSALVEMNDVKATFVGHDHVNDYCYLRQGIQLCYGGGIGFGRAYGDSGFERRARVIEWTSTTNHANRISTWKRYFQDPMYVQEKQLLFSDNGDST